VEMDTRPYEIQYAETGRWAVAASAEQKVYQYEHNTKKCSFSHSKAVHVRYNPTPFAKGTMRFAHYGILDSNKQVVLKKFIFSRGPEYDIIEAKEMVRTQSAARYFAQQFNCTKHSSIPTMEVAELMVLCYGNEIWTMEALITGKYEKWNNNAEYIDDSAHGPQALSHFSWHFSAGEMLLVDLQGVQEGHKFIFTDPAFHTIDSVGFGELNMGTKGFDSYFKGHTCSHICNGMGLRPHPCQLKR